MPFPVLRRPIALLLAATLALGPGGGPPAPAAERLPELGSPAASALPLHEEREIGAEMMRALREQADLLQDPEVNQYVQDLGRRLLAYGDPPELDFHFFVIEDGRINAFAMPGGHIGVHSGLIRETRSESELGGVIAHEIAHVSQRHIARQLAHAQRLNLQTAAALIAAVLLGSQDPQAGSAAAMAGMAAPIQQQLGYSRQHERESDRAGVRLMADAGLDPRGMARFFERLAEASRYAERPPEYLSTHPLTQDRIVEARDLAERARPEDPFNSGHHAFVRARLEVLARQAESSSAVAALRDELRRAAGPTERAAATYGLALALSREARRHEQALALLGTLEPLHAERLYVLLGRAEILRRAGRTEPALAAYAEARSLYPGSSAAVYRYAETLLQLERAEPARRLLSRAVRDGHDTPQLLRLLADAAHASGREAEGYLALARHYHALGELEIARAQLGNAIRTAETAYQRDRAEALRERWTP